MNQFNKPTKIRSKKIRDSARGEVCALRIPDVCNHNPETVVFAHLPGNKGTGTKNHDLFGVYACSECHNWMDGRHWKVVYESKSSASLRALQETQIKLIEKGLIKL